MAKALTFCYKNSDTYGNDLCLKDRVTAFQFTLEGDFCIERILAALRVHMRQSTEMVKPAHIKNILDPEPVKITTAEYIEAKRTQAANNYPAFSSEKTLIEDYEAQQRESRDIRPPLLAPEAMIALQNSSQNKIGEK